MDRTRRPLDDRAIERRRSRSIERNRQSLAALWRIDDLHRHGLAFGKVLDSRRTEDRNMDKNVLAAVIRLDEAEAFVVIEPFDNPRDRNRGRRIRCAALRAGRIATPARRRRPFRRSSGVNLEDASDLSALHAIADIYLQLRAWGNRLISRGLKRADMQERVAGSIAQLDETETLFALKPFDDRVDARPAWRRHFLGTAASGSEARSRGAARPRRIIGRRPIVIETALLGSPEISTFAHDVPARLHKTSYLTLTWRGSQPLAHGLIGRNYQKNACAKRPASQGSQPKIVPTVVVPNAENPVSRKT